MPILIRWLKEWGYSDSKFRDGVLEVTGNGNCMNTATRVASMASLAYEGDVRFFKLGCGERCEYRIKLFPLKV